MVKKKSFFETDTWRDGLRATVGPLERVAEKCQVSKQSDNDIDQLQIFAPMKHSLPSLRFSLAKALCFLPRLMEEDQP